MLRSTISRITSNYPSLFYGLKKADLAFHYAFRLQYESDFLRFKNAAKALPAANVIDVGANIGQSALGFARLFPTGKIFSFEANPDLAGYLKFCCSLVGERLTCRMVGLSEAPSEVTLYIPKRGAVLIYGEASIDRNALDETVKRRVGAFEVAEQRIQLVRFDTLGIRPDIVKIDVQGHELSVLRGMPEAIARDAPLFLIERSSADAAILSYLEPYGYRGFISVGPGPLVPYRADAVGLNMFCMPTDVAARASVVASVLGR